MYFTIALVLNGPSNKYNCEFAELHQEALKYIAENDSIALSGVVNESILLDKQARIDLEVSMLLVPPDILRLFAEFDPIFPVPCAYPSYGFTNWVPCEYYIINESYDCDTSSSKTIPHAGISPLLLGINVALMFVEGYIISCIIVYGYKKIRKKN
jgi:hypothetical protein